MAEYLERERASGHSMLDLPEHDSGELRETWTREQLVDEMRDR